MAQRRTTTARKPAARSAPKSKGVVAGKIPALEWLSAAIGLVLAIAVFAVILTEALTGARTPPALSVHAGKVTPFEGGFVLEVEVRNAGGQTASAVVVEGELKGPGEPETAEANVDYVPARSKAKAGLVFRSDPRAGPVELYAKGYAEP